MSTDSTEEISKHTASYNTQVVNKHYEKKRVKKETHFWEGTKREN
jgi:hypothetical protein